MFKIKDNNVLEDSIRFLKNFSNMSSYKEAVDVVLSELKDLQEQLNYIRSGEYYNQLRFENEMLQQVVDTNGVPSEVYDYIDCTHRNTELLEKKETLIKYLEDEIKSCTYNNISHMVDKGKTLKKILEKVKSGNYE